MSGQLRIVVNFIDGKSITINTEDPETLLEAIGNSDTGWFSYENHIFKREHVTYATIQRPSSMPKARAVKLNNPGFSL